MSREESIDVNADWKSITTFFSNSKEQSVPQEILHVLADLLIEEFSLFRKIESHIGRGKLLECCSHFRRELHSKGSTIFSEGSEADKFFILLQGKLNILKQVKAQEIQSSETALSYKIVNTISPLCIFGQYGLLKQHSKRSASALCLADTVLLSLEKRFFKSYMLRLIEQSLQKMYNFFVQHLQVSEPLAQFRRIIVNKQKLKRGRFIFKEGQDIRGFYLVKAGDVSITKRLPRNYLEHLLILSNGSLLHTSNPLTIRTHRYSAVCLTDCSIFFVQIDDFKYLGSRFGQRALNRLVEGSLENQLDGLLSVRLKSKERKQQQITRVIRPMQSDLKVIRSKEKQRSDVIFESIPNQHYKKMVNEPMQINQRFQSNRNFFRNNTPGTDFAESLFKHINSEYAKITNKKLSFIRRTPLKPSPTAYSITRLATRYKLQSDRREQLFLSEREVVPMSGGESESRGGEGRVRKGKIMKSSRHNYFREHKS